MIAQIFAVLAGLIHVYIFFMESVLWGRPRTNRAFGVSKEVAEHNRLFAFNQGFYNLFLAIAALTGAALNAGAPTSTGTTLMGYAMASMLGAALVLLYSQSKLIVPALIQGLPPLLSLIFLLVG